MNTTLLEIKALAASKTQIFKGKRRVTISLSPCLVEIQAGPGSCRDCSCPEFYGSGYTCSRGGCGHHYDRHW